ncbi:MAG: alpha/beta hydrolase [Lewinellaceae bacterium]|nr:alpha/beta hydrolase [Lewinellaceae bacterium]
MKKVFRWVGIGLLLVSGWGIYQQYYPDRDLADLQAEYRFPDSQIRNIAGMPVHYRITGLGKPLVLLHGTGASLHTWAGWTQELADSFQVISIDLPAFGLTGPHPARDYSIPAYGVFLDSVLTALDIDSCYLAGNSLGGLIAWYYASQHPDQIRKLILIDPAGFPRREVKTPLALRLASSPVFSRALLRVTPKTLFRKSLLDVYGDDRLVTDSLVDQYFQLFLRPGNRQAFVDRAREKSQVDTLLLQRLTMPTLLLWGEADTWIAPSDGQRFMQQLPNAQLITYPGVGHVPMEEIPRQTAADARVFLRGK